MARRALPSIPPGTILSSPRGCYVLGRKLGEGGMGSVFEATDARGGAVAVKTLAAGASASAAETRARFEREVEATAGLHHANVVSVIDHGVDDATGAPYLVMPRMNGEDLGKLLARAGQLEPSVAVAIVVQACRGLAAGHAAGIIHRDVKPSNLFLEQQGGAIVVKVSDFGLAKVKKAGLDSLTGSGALLGTPHYMSPEQAHDPKRVDARTDVYSLGMVLYHALAGAPAFTSSGAFMAFVVGKSAAPAVQQRAPWISPSLARAVHAAILRSPAARWPDFAELELGLVMAAGFDAANAPLSAASLAGPSPATRERLAERAALPAHWQDLLRR